MKRSQTAKKRFETPRSFIGFIYFCRNLFSYEKLFFVKNDIVGGIDYVGVCL